MSGLRYVPREMVSGSGMYGWAQERGLGSRKNEGSRKRDKKEELREVCGVGVWGAVLHQEGCTTEG